MHLGVAPVSTAGPAATDSTLVRGRWLVLVRTVWVAVAMLTVGLFVASVPLHLAQLTDGQARQDLGLNLEFQLVHLALAIVFAAVHVSVGAFIFWRRSDNWMASSVALTLLTFGAVSFTQFPSVLVQAYPAAWLPVVLVEILGAIFLGLFFYLFPDGHFVPRWTRWLAVLWAGIYGTSALFPDAPFSSSAWPSPLLNLVWLGFIGSFLFAQMYRYRRVSAPTQRQQTKWVVFGMTLALGGYLLATWLFSLFWSPDQDELVGLARDVALMLFMLVIPLSIAFAVLRYRLWDIDALINRTLVYGALTASVVGLYVLAVGALGALLQTPGNLLISLLATGLIAVLFHPLRERLQRSVNRLMYGDRDDPYHVLARLGQRLEAALAPDAVLPTIVETVKDALKLPYTAIALKQDDSLTLAAAAGEPTADTISLPLAYQGETIGQLLLGQRAPGERFTPADRRLLDDLARPAGIAAHAVLLTADLERSRLRIVSAREEARRQLGSDLHDGLGHRLAGLMRKAETAANLLDHEPATARVLLAELTQQAKAAIAEVRALAHQLHPPELELLGLVEALRERAQVYAASGGDGLQIRIEVPETLPRLPAAVEVAAYYIALEALTNVQRHAAAQHCIVRLALAPRDGDDSSLLSVLGVPILELEISDNGRGIPARAQTPGTGLGLRSMQERAAELGGRCVIERAAAGGTRVSARLPCRHFV
jgi:signal transduction histidine kinase